MDFDNRAVMTVAATSNPVLNMVVHGNAVAGLALADDLDSIAT